MVRTNYVGSLDAFKDKMAAQGAHGMRYMGQRTPDVDGTSIVTGNVKYTTNVQIPGMLHAKFVRNPYAHATIDSIDTSAAQNMPGVVAVYTGKSPEFAGKLNLGDEPLLADTEVFYNMQPVAVVVAETIEQAEDAVFAINVKYTPKDVITDPVSASDKSPPVIVHTPRLITPPFEADRPNVINCFYVKSGDTTKGFADADVIVESDFDVAGDPHAYIVPISGVAQPNGDGSITLWTDVQNIHPVPWPTAAGAADLPLDKVITIGPQKATSGFGGKNCGVPGVYATLLAKLTGRPVRVIFDDFKLLHSSRPWFHAHVKAGAKNDGKFTAFETTVYVCTPYCRFTLTVMERAREALTCTYHWGHPDLYKVPNVMFTAYDSYANTSDTMSYRGFGACESSYAFEGIINMLAEKLGMDKVDLRLMNLVKEGDFSAQHEIVRGIGMAGLLTKTKELMTAWGPKPSVQDPWVVGRGISGANKYSQGDMVHNLIFLKLRASGLVDIIADTMDIGQGANTVIRQFVAETLNVPIENVHRTDVNTEYVPWTSDSFSSSASVDFGGAILTAAKNARNELFAAAATMLKAKAGDLDTMDGKIFVKGKPETSVTWGDAMAPRLHMIASGGLNDPVGAPNDYDGPGKNDYGTGQALGPYYRLVMHMDFMANAYEIMLNKETGEVRVTKMLAGNDMLPINPTLCEGQMIGGMYHGLANGLYEQPYIDKGIYTAKSYLDFKMPTILDMPKVDDTDTAIVPIWAQYFGENPIIDCPFGAKGIGEGVLNSSMPALQDAIHDAIGVWITNTPMATQARILSALGKA
jgi:CO/xanthine dehydrogenase Mo-binding subunit